MSRRGRNNQSQRLMHSPRNAIIPPGPVQVPPAWQSQERSRRVVEAHEKRVTINTDVPTDGKVTIKDREGGHILVENLPEDTKLEHIHELFNKIVGRVEFCDMFYNNKGQFKGMATVVFGDSNHAFVARQKFHGKLIDFNRPLQVRIIMDLNDNPVLRPQPRPTLLDSFSQNNFTPDHVVHNRQPDVAQSKPYTKPATQARPKPQHTTSGPSLLSRLGPVPLSQRVAKIPSAPRYESGPVFATGTVPTPGEIHTTHPSIPSHIPPANFQGRVRVRKGPKRLAKTTARQIAAAAVSGRFIPKHKTAEELDAEMVNYNAARPVAF